MKIEYMREMKRSYMTVKWEDENKKESYETGMLEKNQIPGLLKMKVKYADGEFVYCYDITSRQPLSRLFEHHPADERQVRSFFLQLYKTLDQMEAYLLGDDGILLDPELIYVDPEDFKAGFCVVPGRKEDFNHQLNQFIQYLMKHIDHKDRECVVLTYGLYQASMKDNYGLEELMGILSERIPEKAEEKIREERELTEDKREKERENVKWESHTWEEEDVKEGRKEENDLVKELLFVLLFLAAAAGGTWFLYGKDVLAEYWIYGAAGGIVLEMGVVIRHFILAKRRKSKEPEAEETETEDPWRMYYEPPEEKWDTDPQKEKDNPWKGTGKEIEKQDRKKEEQEFQTVLLTVKEAPAHALVSAVPENQDIPVEYVPFVIGKHEGLADYILDKGTVSRFHARITEAEGQYFLTDLNSTNGTRVNGRLLAANEEVMLNAGDEVCIAEERYFWR